nr:hypothetical protein [Streptomyces beijiangensis]
MGEAKHGPGDAQAVGDAFDYVDVCEATPSGHDLADSARRHSAQCRDPRRVDASLDFDQPKDAGEIPAAACLLPLPTGQQFDRQGQVDL